MEAGQVYRPEHAGFIRQQRLLAAGVGALDGAKAGRRVIAVDAIDEDHARLAVAPGGFDDATEDRARIELPDSQTGSGINQIVRRSRLDSLHEFVSYSHGD